MNRLFNLARRMTRGRPQVGLTPADVVHRENKWRLLRYRPRKLKYETPVLLVPSLINRHYVLDLMPGKSFAEYLVAQGPVDYDCQNKQSECAHQGRLREAQPKAQNVLVAGNHFPAETLHLFLQR